MLCAVLLLTLPTGRAEARGEPGPVAAVRAELLGKLHAIAEFCAARQLFASRHDVYDLVLSIWPDDEVARKWNGYERFEDGSWSTEGRKRPRNLMATGLPALRALQTETATWYLGAMDEAAAPLPPALSAAWKARAVADAVRIAPDDEALRERGGEVRGKDAKGKKAWILVETERSRARRPMLREAGAKALKSVPHAKPGEVHESEKSSTVTWSTALQGGRARLTGTTDPKELEQVLRNAEAAFPLFQAAFDRAPPSFGGLTLHVVDNVATGNVYLADQPETNREWLRFVAPLAALWIPKSARIMLKSEDPLVRLEGGARQVNGAFMANLYGVNSKMGWAVEGFGLYLTWHVTGTRLLNSVRQNQYGEKEEKADFAKRLRAGNTDWMAEARTLIAGTNAPDLRLLLGKTVNTMTPEDVLYSYVFAQFLVEGHHEQLAEFLPAVAGVTDAEYDVPFAAYLGFDVASAQARIKRWLEETANLK